MTKISYRGYTISNRTGRKVDHFVSFDGRVRWGTLAECMADIDHILAYGHLPARIPGSWA